MKGGVRRENSRKMPELQPLGVDGGRPWAARSIPPASFIGRQDDSLALGELRDRQAYHVGTVETGFVAQLAQNAQMGLA